MSKFEWFEKMNTDGGLRQVNQDMQVWERMWAPYDESTYQSVLEKIYPEDILLDIGAGDLRLARRAAGIARKVYAIEVRGVLIDQSSARGPLPENIRVIRGDARSLYFPEEVTCGILLMRHCSHFQLYAAKLKAVGARRLVTNARWGFSVETVWLKAPRIDYQDLDIGWYACWCGAVGFKPGLVERLVPEVEARVHEVKGCPECGTR